MEDAMKKIKMQDKANGRAPHRELSRRSLLLASTALAAASAVPASDTVSAQQKSPQGTPKKPAISIT